MIKVIIDSTCDLSQKVIDKYDIKMLNLMVNINDEGFRDKKEITTQELYQKIRENVDIKTSLPPTDDIYTLFRDYASRGIDFIYLAFSSKLSGTHDLACSILNEVKEEYPHVKMEIVDSKAGGLAIGLIAHEMVKKIEETNNFEDVLAYGRYMADHIKLYFMVNDLSQLAKGGRINKTVASIGNTFHIRPILYLDDGEIKLLTQTRGTKKALKKLVDIVKKDTYDKNQTIAINYSSNEQLAEDVSDLIKDEGFDNLVYQPIGSVLSTHIGLDAVGVFFFDSLNK